MLYIYILNKKGEHSEIKQLLKNKIKIAISVILSI